MMSNKTFSKAEKKSYYNGLRAGINKSNPKPGAMTARVMEKWEIRNKTK